MWRFRGKLVAASLLVLPVGMAAAQTQLASLRPHQELVWQRTSPGTNSLDGPILYALIIRSSATPGNIPVISPAYTLGNSPISVNGNNISIAGTAGMTGFQLSTGAVMGNVLTSDGSGIGTWQPAVTNIATGAGLTGGPITTTGTISIATGGVTPAMVSATGSANNQVLTSNGSAVSWQDAPAPGLFCGTTASKYDGNLGGYTGARSLCQTACGSAKAHMCTNDEVVRSLQLGISIDGWYSTGVSVVIPGTTLIIHDECFGWTSNQSALQGPHSGGSMVGYTPCNIALNVACCR